jgi:hypothetical protein
VPTILRRGPFPEADATMAMGKGGELFFEKMRGVGKSKLNV